MIPIQARRKAMLAASRVEVTTCRESAIVGGIVRCIIATGRYNGPWVAQYAADAIDEFKLTGVDRSVPGPTEVTMVAERFAAAYGRPLAA